MRAEVRRVKVLMCVASRVNTCFVLVNQVRFITVFAPLNLLIYSFCKDSIKNKPQIAVKIGA